MEGQDRILPVISLTPEADFYVDSFKGLLIDTKDKTNVMHILEMLPTDTHYEMLFDKERRNLKETNWTSVDPDRYVYIWIRPLEVYDPEGANLRPEKKRIIPENLPVINIAGKKFLWDGIRSRFLQQSNPYNQIYKNDVQLYDGKMGFYFDSQKNVVPFSHELEALKIKGELPPHIHFIDASEINKQINNSKNMSAKIQPKNNGRKLR